VVGAGATADRFAAQASMPGGPRLHSRRQGDMPQHNSAWTQSAQLAIGVMADLCPEPTAIEITATNTCIEPCLSEEPRPAIEDDECDDAADAKKQLQEPERCCAKTLQTTAWADLQQTELARSSSNTHHEVGAR
jgi:hypothetical protein